MRRKYICTNGVVEVTQFVVGDKQTGGRKWHRAKSQEDKRDENARQAVRVAARILNCNYCQEDALLTMTYSDEEHARLFAGLDPDETLEKAKKVLSGVLEKVRKELKNGRIATSATPPRNDREKSAADMRTFAVTADMDGETGELVRVHHHVVVTSAAAQSIAERWSHGIVHTESLYKQDDYTPLATYLLGQVRHREGKKKYSCSRNMVKPKVEEQVLAEAPDNEIRVQPGAKVLDRTPYREGTLSQYVRYKRKPRAAKRGGHKEGRIATSASGLLAMTAEDEEAGACGGTEICEDAKGGSGYDFSKITWR